MAKLFTLITSAILLVFGICGLIPPFVYSPAAMDTKSTDIGATHFGPGRLFNVFTINYLLTALFLILGIAGIVAALSPAYTKRYLRVLVGLCVLFLFCGLIPGLSTMFGFLPLGGWKIGIWFILAFAAFYPAFLEGPLMKSINEPVFRQPS